MTHLRDITAALANSATGTIDVAITCMDNEDFDQFVDYTAFMQIDRVFQRGIGRTEAWFITGMIDMRECDGHPSLGDETEYCDATCDITSAERFDIAVDDIDDIDFHINGTPNFG